MNRIKLINLISIVAASLLLAACNNAAPSEDTGRINVVTTIYPPADFASQVGGEYVNVNQLLKPGAESHTYEPTPKDILAIQNCDLFIYVGGESDAWIDDILSSIDTSKVHTLKMIDAVDVLAEELVDGMEEESEEGEGEEEELDEHVWTCVNNAALITDEICEQLVLIDPEHEAYYKQNCDSYTEQLMALDKEYRDVVSSAKRTEIIVADRFPFRYMAHEYGLSYYAAFPGCSADSEPSARTLSFLIDKAQEDNIPVVFHIEFSSEKIADSVVEVCGAKKSLLHSCHNLSQDEWESGADYISIMTQNLKNLEEALN